MTLAAITFFALCLLSTCLLVVRALSRCSIRAHGKRLLLCAIALGPGLYNLSFVVPERVLASRLREQAPGACGVAMVFGVAMLLVREKHPEITDILGRIAGSSWEMGIGALAILGGLVSLLAASLIPAMALPSMVVLVVGGGLVIHGFVRRTKLDEQLHRLRGTAPPPPQAF